MCGIVGLFLKDKALEPKLGAMLADMLAKLGDRGPDSAGLAIYSGADDGVGKITVQSPNPAEDFPELAAALSAAIGAEVEIAVRDTHAVLSLPIDLARCRAEGDPQRQSAPPHHGRRRRHRDLQGGRLSDRSCRERFDLANMTGTHGIGHTRMATESAVTTLGAHPFSTGPDECLVHNGSLSNHNNVRRELVRDGMTFETENDTEVAAAYLTWRMNQGMDLGRGAGPEPGRPRRLLHLRGRHQDRLRRAARSDRLQAGGARRDGSLRRLRLRIPRARRPARHRKREGLGAGAGDRLFLGTLMPTVDLAETSLREFNQTLHR